MRVQPLPLKFTRIDGILVFVAVSLLISARPLHEPWLMYIFKPVATALIVAISLRNWRQQSSPFALWISLGLFLSLIGDIVLMLHGNLFLYGLTAFLLAHISYLSGFSRDVKFPARVSVWIRYLAIIGSFYDFSFLPSLQACLCRLPFMYLW
jgi:alkenylglycerophosphocholine/alkenylglycerophosphoethanolamine hydrolase